MTMAMSMSEDMIETTVRTLQVVSQTMTSKATAAITAETLSVCAEAPESSSSVALSVASRFEACEAKVSQSVDRVLDLRDERTYTVGVKAA